MARSSSITSISPRRTRSPPCGSASRRWCSISAIKPTSRKGCKVSSPSIMARPSGWCAARRGFRNTPMKPLTTRRSSVCANAPRRWAMLPITEDQAHIEVELTYGEKLTRFVEKSLGNIHRPLTDRAARGEVPGSGRARSARRTGGEAHRAVLANRRARGCERLRRWRIPLASQSRLGRASVRFTWMIMIQTCASSSSSCCSRCALLGRPRPR